MVDFKILLRFKRVLPNFKQLFPVSFNLCYYYYLFQLILILSFFESHPQFAALGSFPICVS